MLAIYHWEPSAHSGKPLLAACEKGVGFESHYVDMLAFDQHSPRYLRINPDGTIPVMIHDGVLVAESTAMMEYLDEAFDGPSLRPSDPFQRWRMRWWCRYFDQFVTPAVSMFGWQSFVGPSVRQRDPRRLGARLARIPQESRRIAWSKAISGAFTAEELTESARRIELAVKEIEELLSERAWLAGESYSLADIAGFSTLACLPMRKPELVNDRGAPRLMAWLRRINDRPAVQRAQQLGRTELMQHYAFLAGERWPGA